jgi:hypothetical protein
MLQRGALRLSTNKISKIITVYPKEINANLTFFGLLSNFRWHEFYP